MEVASSKQITWNVSSKRKRCSFTRREQERKNASKKYNSISWLRDSVEKGGVTLVIADVQEVLAVIAELFFRFQ